MKRLLTVWCPPERRRFYAGPVTYRSERCRTAHELARCTCHHGSMVQTFTLNGTAYGFLPSDPGDVEATHSWEYGKQPKVLATLALVGGGTLDVYARAQRWNTSHILAAWEDDDRRPHWAWVPAGSVRRVNDSEWDIWAYHRCPENLRGVRWSNRLPGFLTG